MKWQGATRSGKKWQGVARSGKERQGVARSGKEWQGVARSGMKWQGGARSEKEDGMERHLFVPDARPSFLSLSSSLLNGNYFEMKLLQVKSSRHVSAQWKPKCLFPDPDIFEKSDQ